MTNQTDNCNGITKWLDNAGRYPLLPAERVTAIAREIQGLPEANPKRRKLINTLVKHNLRLVPRFVRGFMDRSSHNKWGCAETVDYLQTGSFGLVRAAEKFDPARGYTFATYANFWIRSMVGRYNLKTLTPVYVSESVSRQLIFYKRNGYLNNRHSGTPFERSKLEDMKRLAAAAYGCISLNVPNEYGHELMDCIQDNGEDVRLEQFANGIHEAMDQAGISATGKEVLLAYVVHEETMKQIGERLGLTINRVRREKDLAFRQARACPQAFGAGII